MMSKKEEERCLLEDLIQIQEGLMEDRQRIQALVEAKVPRNMVSLRLRSPDSMLAPYEVLARTSEHARRLLENIKGLMQDIRIIAREYLDE
jgi:hypothetical protein